MQDRPISVTIVGWVLVVLGVIGAIALAMTYDGPEAERVLVPTMSPVVQQIIGLASIAISLISGLGVLHRKNWARWLYVLWNVVSIGLALFTSTATTLLILSVVMVAVIAFFLFWKPANAWFMGEGSTELP